MFIVRGCAWPLVFVTAALSHPLDCWSQTLTPEQRAEAIISKMTLAEKIQQLHGAASKVHQRWVPGIEGLGIPPLTMGNGPAGIGPTDVVQPHATAFPSPIAVAASWDRHDAWLYGASVADEMQAIGRTMLEAPTVNICRIPASGRTFEGYGEDPFLSAETAVANIKGIQSLNMLANVKHFALNNQEADRQFVDVIADERTMREIYFPAFEAAVKSANVASLMCSYNKINGDYACENKYLLKDVLRTDWGFNGFVVSDFGAAHDGRHDLFAGLDLEMPQGDTYNSKFEQLVKDDIVTTRQIDDLLRHRYATMIRFGLFDHKAQTHAIAEEEHGETARLLAADSIVLLRNQESLLPLDEDRVKSIAVVGPAADQLVEGGGAASVLPLHTITPIQGIRNRFAAAQIRYVPVSSVGFIDPHDTIDGLSLSPAGASSRKDGITAEYFANTSFSGAPHVVRTERLPEIRSEFGAPIPDMLPNFSLRWTGILKVPATGDYTLGIELWGKMRLFLDGQLILEQSNSRDLQALSRKISLQQGHAYTLRAEYISTGRGLARIFWALPTGIDPPSLIRAVEAARSSDVAIVFAGTWAHEGFDASTLALPRSQNQLIEAVAAANPRTIVVLQSGTPVLMPWINKVASVLEAWFPGEEGGAAIAAVLSGDVNPSAKLPLTFPMSDDQVPTSSADQYPGINRTEHYTEGLNVGYRWQDSRHKTPLFPFGFGLSYTRFKLSDLTYEVLADHTINVSVTVENQGPRAGAIIPQLYVTYPGSAGEPPVQLRGFAKVYLPSRTIQKVHFRLEARDFSIWSIASHSWNIVPGEYILAAGDSSRNLLLRKTIPQDSVMQLSSPIDKNTSASISK